MANLRREEEGEMSIEEILASIRRYVGDEPQPQSKPQEESSLAEPKLDQSYMSTRIGAEQTAEALAASLSMGKPDLRAEPLAFDQSIEPARYNNAPENVIRLTEAHAVRPDPQLILTPDNQSDNREVLLSPQAQAATAQSFAKLAEATTHARHLSKPEPATQTLDQLIADLARPMIKQWLDQHLPRLVELTVTKEIERLTKQLRHD